MKHIITIPIDPKPSLNWAQRLIDKWFMPEYHAGNTVSFYLKEDEHGWKHHVIQTNFEEISPAGHDKPA